MDRNGTYITQSDGSDGYTPGTWSWRIVQVDGRESRGGGWSSREDAEQEASRIELEMTGGE